ncbi:MAG: hypothetical protein FJW20_17100 [Acidimicrobiia bacterium]|nr:hypothetical protein [Acidimicrobiia bacterium]
MISHLVRIAAVSAMAAVAAMGQPAPAAAGKVQCNGFLRSRVEGWNWFGGTQNSNYAFSGNHLRLGISQQRGAFDWKLDFAAPFFLGLPDDAIAPAPQLQLGLGGNYFAANKRRSNAGMVFLKEGFLRWKFDEATHSVRLGRFEFNDGTEVMPKDPVLAALKRERIVVRLIGTFGFTHVMRSFDGFHYVYNKPKFNFTLVGAMPTRGVFQVDGWGNLHTGFLYAAATGQVHAKENNGEWRLMGIYYHDWRNVLMTDNLPPAARRANIGNVRIGSFGGHYLQKVQSGAGPFDIMLWGVGQTGRWGRLDHSGGVIAAELGWQPDGLPKLKPWLRAAYSHGTGDNDPNDNKHTTFFQMLPTPRPYARFPFFNMMNNEDFGTMLMLRPHAKVTFNAEAHALRLANRNDLWYLGGGAFQPWSFGYIGRPSNGARSLANLFDTGVDLRVTPQVTLSGYFGYAIGKSVTAAIYPRDKDGSFGYMELMYRFR